jgi:hypothetical protein
LSPEDAHAHRALAHTLATSGQLAEGICHYRRPLAIEPHREGALLDPGWILATTKIPT